MRYLLQLSYAVCYHISHHRHLPLDLKSVPLVGEEVFRGLGRPVLVDLTLKPEQPCYSFDDIKNANGAEFKGQRTVYVIIIRGGQHGFCRNSR